MTRTISALFDTYADAAAAVDDLETMGVPSSDISIVGHGHDGPAQGKPEIIARDAGAGVGIGATLGGIGGLLAGLGMIAIPGIGPVLAAGGLASMITGAVGGAVVGGAAGGLVGALTDAGVPEDEAHLYAEGVRRGGTLVTAKVNDGDDEADQILHRRATDIRARGVDYQAGGWSRFQPEYPELTADELLAERQRRAPPGEPRSFATPSSAAADIADGREPREREASERETPDSGPGYVPPPIAD